MARARYAGTSRKLLIAFDIGTTFSGASYSILDPGEIPEIRTVTRFPLQEHVGGDTKIPTIIYYDQKGKVRAIGAEALKEGIEVDAEEEGWDKAEWFKLHMRPKGSASAVTHDIPPLPPKKTVINILADYLRYLHNCTKTFIQETHVAGDHLWNSLRSNTVFVLTHPNGWGGPQQKQMRTAAVRAGLIQNTEEGNKRLSFVTEGEASLHYCVCNGLAVDGTKNGAGVLIIDAGGGTIDISAYRKVNEGKYEEIAAPDCLFQGSVFVTSRAREYLTDHLKGSRFFDDVDILADRFDKKAKHSFRSDNEPQFIQFASARERDTALGINAGRLKLAGSVVAAFFGPSIRQIIAAVKKQQADSPHPISSVFLVGGFAANSWLFSKLKAALEPSGLQVFRPDSHVNKAVVDGAVSYYLDHFVDGRISKMAYGTAIYMPYNPHNAEHVKRSESVYQDMFDGTSNLPGGFDVILPKNMKVTETQEFRRPYSRSDWNPPSNDFEVSVSCYRGKLTNPSWLDVDSGMYTDLCTIKADLSSTKPQIQYSPSARRFYYTATFEIVLLFGLTELKAQIAYIENGVEKRGPAQIVYGDV